MKTKRRKKGNAATTKKIFKFIKYISVFLVILILGLYFLKEESASLPPEKKTFFPIQEIDSSIFLSLYRFCENNRLDTSRRSVAVYDSMFYPQKCQQSLHVFGGKSGNPGLPAPICYPDYQNGRVNKNIIQVKNSAWSSDGQKAAYVSRSMVSRSDHIVIINGKQQEGFKPPALLIKDYLRKLNGYYYPHQITGLVNPGLSIVGIPEINISKLCWLEDNERLIFSAEGKFYQIDVR